LIEVKAGFVGWLLDSIYKYIAGNTISMRSRSSTLPTLLAAALTSTAVMAEPPPARQTELLYLLRHDCGSCHGMRLEGGLGPPLTPERLRPWSAEQLVPTILHGRPGTPMPPWRPFFTDGETLWLAQRLKQGIGRP
jgi:cytochrome c55X